MNENIMAMVAELESNFPIKWEQHDKIKDLHLRIYDDRGYKFGIDKEFNEELFSNLFIYYRGNVLEIIKYQYNVFDINTDVLIEQEDLAIIAKAMSIVAKHLSKIEFEAHL